MSQPIQMSQDNVNQAAQLQTELSGEIDKRMSSLKMQVEQTLAQSGSQMTHALDSAVDDLSKQCKKAVTDVTGRSAEQMQTTARNFTQSDQSNSQAVSKAGSFLAGQSY